MANKRKKTESGVSVRELPSKIKEILSQPAQKEESKLEEEIENRESERFNDFVSSPSVRILGAEGRVLSREVPEAEEPREIVPEPIRTQETQRPYEPTKYTLSQRPRVTSSASEAVPIFRPEGQGHLTGPGRDFENKELARLRGETEEMSETQYKVEIDKSKRRKMLWE